MASATYEVAQVLERNKEVLADYCANSRQLRTLHAFRKCRTAALGGHIDCCNNPSCRRLHLATIAAVTDIVPSARDTKRKPG